VNTSSGLLTYANRTFTGSGSSVPTTFVTPTNALISLSPLRAVRPNGAHLYVSDAAASTIAQYTIAANGSFSATGTPPVATGATPTALAVDRSGQFAYALSPTDATISQYAINAATGALTALSPATIATCSQAASFAVEPSSRFAYVSCANDSTVQQFRITASGALSYIGAVNTSPAGTPGTIAIAGPGL
jgi:6-phosphogluconolactonase (cycloisomerase 2 family)